MSYRTIESQYWQRPQSSCSPTLSFFNEETETWGVKGLDLPKTHSCLLTVMPKTFPNSPSRTCSSACCYHPLLKIKTSAAWNLETISIVGKKRKGTCQGGYQQGKEYVSVTPHTSFTSHLSCYSLIPLYEIKQNEVNLVALPKLCIYVSRCDLLGKFCLHVISKHRLFVSNKLIDHRYFLEPNYLSPTMKCSAEFSGVVHEMGRFLSTGYF